MSSAERSKRREQALEILQPALGDRAKAKARELTEEMIPFRIDGIDCVARSNTEIALRFAYIEGYSEALRDARRLGVAGK